MLSLSYLVKVAYTEGNEEVKTEAWFVKVIQSKTVHPLVISLTLKS